MTAWSSDYCGLQDLVRDEEDEDYRRWERRNVGQSWFSTERRLSGSRSTSGGSSEVTLEEEDVDLDGGLPLIRALSEVAGVEVAGSKASVAGDDRRA